MPNKSCGCTADKEYFDCINRDKLDSPYRARNCYGTDWKETTITEYRGKDEVPLKLHKPTVRNDLTPASPKFNKWRGVYDKKREKECKACYTARILRGGCAE